MQLEDKALFYILYDCIVNCQKKMVCITQLDDKITFFHDSFSFFFTPSKIKNCEN